MKRAGGALLLGIDIDHGSARPLSTQLTVILRDLILDGSFAAGDRLPASRTLARDLGLSRTTVIEAFERLVAEGLVESRVGAGTFVAGVLRTERPLPVPAAQAASLTARKPKLSRAMAAAMAAFAPRQRLPHAPRAFVTGLPALDAFPMAQWARLSAKHWRRQRDTVMGYGEACGHPLLRRAIAGHLRANRGIACETEQIFVTGGAQQAFHLIGTVLLDPGDKVWFENPGPIGARNSMVANGAELVPLPVDEEGLCVAAGLAASRQFRLAFVTPSHQQPLGSVMSLERRFALLHAAEQAGAWVVEDDYDGEFFFGNRPLPTLKSVDATGRVIYVGTFSKSLFPSLRLGFMLAPPALVDTFAAMMSAYLPGVPSCTQEVAAEFIADGHFSAHIRRMRRLYAERHAALRDAAKPRLDGLLAIEEADSGLHTIGHLGAGLAERDAASAAEKQGVSVSPIARFAIAPVAVRGLVLGFGGIKPPEIRAGVETLAQVLERLVLRRAS
ncbi:MAG: PLP-dependent aminotransferase family protein [Alphaproteobacteria bacterium]|nr:PLP-dependent aminotransferase family protein [Alphaproteobacteria bacterium]